MPDPYASIAASESALQQRLAQALELRATDPVQEAILQSYLAEISLPPGARVLEVGSGTGTVCRVLSRLANVGSVMGIDPSSVFVERARELSRGYERVSFAVGDGWALELGEGEFDLVVFHTTLSHVPDPRRVLAEAYRVLEPGGCLAICDGDYTTASVSISESDPLQAPLDVTVRNFVEHPWLSRQLPGLLTAMGLSIDSFRTHGYTKLTEASYFMSLLERGLDLMVAAGTLGAEAAQALRQEALRRQETGAFFGHISYVSVICHRPA